MKVNPIIQETIAAKILAANAEREAREPSGRLSASKLGWPLQWQMLHHFKVPTKQTDEYTLRKFQRGNDVEDRIVDWLDLPEDKKQVNVEYRGVVGRLDIEMEYPIEIKSCTNLAFKRRQKDGPGYSHKLQGELYAKARGHDRFGVAYVASDDYRVLCFEEMVSGEVDKIIDEYEAQVAKGTVPVFVAREPWQAIAEYNPYPDWIKLSEEEIAKRLLDHLKSTT